MSDARFDELLDRTLAKVRDNNNVNFTREERIMKGFLDEVMDMGIIRESDLYADNNNNGPSDEIREKLFDELVRQNAHALYYEEESNGSRIMSYIDSARSGGRRRKTMRRGRKGKKAKKSAKRGKKAKKSAKRGKKAKKSARRTRRKN